jgi:hypothetical protein
MWRAYTDDSNVTLRAMSITIYKTTMEACYPEAQ